MTLDPRFVIAPSLQQYFVDKDTGLPLAAGIVTFYSDSSRTTLKPVYEYNSTSFPNYTALPNPMTLSSVGTMMDDSGNDILPFYYPYTGTPTDNTGILELYYITVQSSGLVEQFTREAFPPIVSNSTISPTLGYTNYIVDGQFRIHNNVTPSPPLQMGQITQASTILTQGGWSFQRNTGSTATDLVTFTSFGNAVSTPTTSPRYYVTVATQVPAGGDTLKALRFQWSDVNKFETSTGQTYTFYIEGMSASGSTAVQLYSVKNYGTGGSTEVDTLLHTFNIPASWSQQSYSFNFGNNLGKTISSLNDDFVALDLRMPIGSAYNCSFTNGVLAIGTVSIQSFPETTDQQFQYQSIAPAIPAFDGSNLYLPAVLTPTGLSYSTSNIGKLYWNSYDAIEPDELNCNGSMYPVAGYSPIGIPYSRLWNKWYNFNSNMPKYGTGYPYVTSLVVNTTATLLIITNSQGPVAPSADGSIPTTFTISTSCTGYTPFMNAGRGYDGIYPYLYVQDQLIGSVTAATIGTVGTGSVTQVYNNSQVQQLFQVYNPLPASNATAQYMTFTSTTSGAYYLWFPVNGTGSDPVPGGTGIEVDLLSTMNSTDVVTMLTGAIAGSQITTITLKAATSVTPGSYFTFNCSFGSFYVWYTVDNVGNDPGIAGKIGIEVDLLSSDNAVLVNDRTNHAINSQYFATPDAQGLFLRNQDLTDEVDLYADQRISFGNTYNLGDVSGTYEWDTIASHLHKIPTSLTAASGSAIDAQGGASSTPTQSTGYQETRPRNMSAILVVKY